jgi:APA family basic amino acid/polyamine antiporter
MFFGTTPNVFPIIFLWITGGILALCGALCYAELATALPESGGEYHFLSRIYHPSLGFCAGLCSVLVGFAAPCAINALLFATYLKDAIPQIAEYCPRWGEHLIAIALVSGLTFAHLRSLSFTGLLQSSAMFITVSLITVFICAGFIFPDPQPVHFLPQAGDGAVLLGGTFWSCLVYVMYAYSGWNAATYIAGEVKDPAKTLPKALVYGTIFVMVIYVVLNAVFLYSTPLDVLSKNQEIAHEAGKRIFHSEYGARFVSGLMCIGLAANISAMVWIGSRVSQAIGNHFPILQILARTSETRVPWMALLIQLGIVLFLLAPHLYNTAPADPADASNYVTLFGGRVYMVYDDPGDIVKYVQCVLILCSTLTVFGVIVLRFTDPDLPRPYKAFGYPLTPLLFTAISCWCLYYFSKGDKDDPTSFIWVGSFPLSIIALKGTITSLVGIPIYFIARKWGYSETAHPPAPDVVSDTNT